MPSNPWVLGGNANTNPQNDCLGTTDNEPLVIKTVGTERARVDAGGNVGIGNAAPQTALHIKSLTTVSEAASPAGAWANLGSNSYYDGAWNRVDATKAAVNFHMNADDGAGEEFRFRRVEADGTNPRNIAVLGSKTSSIVESNVGVGTSQPSYRLHVVGNSGNHAAFVSSDVSPNWWANQLALIGSATYSEARLGFATTWPDGSGNHTAIIKTVVNPDKNADLVFQVKEPANMTERMRITSQGNVGIGTTAPQRKVQIGDDVVGLSFDTGTSPNAGVLRFGDGTGWKLHFGRSRESSGGALNSATDGILVTVQDNGNVGIGTTTPSSKLQVNGDVSVSGDVILTGADCAEHFDVCGSEPLEPGTVVVIDEDGALREGHDAYDKKVAGVVSGAGDYRHGLVLDNRPSEEGRIPVALVGKVYCKVDAEYSPIEVGDLLTTSATPGHAMKASDQAKAFGSVIGKALRSLQGGQDLIPILIALQ